MYNATEGIEKPMFCKYNVVTVEWYSPCISEYVIVIQQLQGVIWAIYQCIGVD